MNNSITSITNRRTGASGKNGWAVILLMAVSLSVTLTASGQTNIRLGATTGLNVSTVVRDNESMDIKGGFRGGMVADFGLHKNFSIVPELLFSQKGWKTLEDRNNPGFFQTSALNYLELPISLVLKMRIAGNTRVTLFPAYYAAYAVSGKVKQESESGKSAMKLPLGKGENKVNPLDMGLNLGLGIEGSHLFFKFQLHAGLKNLSNVKSTVINNSAFSLNLGYFIR